MFLTEELIKFIIMLNNNYVPLCDVYTFKIIMKIIQFS